MSAPMTFPQFRDLLKHISHEHSPNRDPVNPKGRQVKYVDPHIDMRTGHVFALKLRGYTWDKTLHTQNECRDLKESLYDRCMQFLDGEGAVDRPSLARKKLFEVVCGELGQAMAQAGQEFGADEVKFTVPLSTLIEAIEEMDHE